MTSLKKNAVLSPDQTVLNLTAMGSASHQETTSASCTTQIRAFSMKPVIYWAEKNLTPSSLLLLSADGAKKSSYCHVISFAGYRFREGEKKVITVIKDNLDMDAYICDSAAALSITCSPRQEKKSPSE